MVNQYILHKSLPIAFSIKPSEQAATIFSFLIACSGKFGHKTAYPNVPEKKKKKKKKKHTQNSTCTCKVKKAQIISNWFATNKHYDF